MSPHVDVAPSLLRWACERNRLDVADYADRFPHLRDWIGAARKPTLKQLESFAKATHAPVGFLFLSEPPEETVPIPDFRTVAGAELHRPSPQLLDTIYACQARQDWYREFARTVREPALSFVGSADVHDDVVATARRIRETLGVDESEERLHSDRLSYWIERAEAVGILVMRSGIVQNDTSRPLDPAEFRGFALSDPIAPLIFVNGADAKSAQLFTFAHELAHVWQGADGVSDAQPRGAKGNRTEVWCNAVGAELVVPMRELRATLHKGETLDAALERLTKHFKVSRLVILRRLRDADRLTAAQFEQAYGRELAKLRALDKPKRSSGGNFYATLGTRVGKRFARALIISTLEGQTLYRDAFRMLGMSKRETFDQFARTVGA